MTATLPDPTPTPAYIGVDPRCGCAVAIVVDSPKFRTSAASSVADFIRDGLMVERVTCAEGTARIAARKACCRKPAPPRQTTLGKQRSASSGTTSTRERDTPRMSTSTSDRAPAPTPTDAERLAQIRARVEAQGGAPVYHLNDALLIQEIPYLLSRLEASEAALDLAREALDGIARDVRARGCEACAEKESMARAALEGTASQEPRATQPQTEGA